MKAFVVARYGKDEVRAADVPEPRPVTGTSSSRSAQRVSTRWTAWSATESSNSSSSTSHRSCSATTWPVWSPKVGADVRGFAVGDEVFARPRDLRIGTFAEYIAIDEDDVALKPATLSLHEAAAVPLVALAAWQILVERAHIQPGQKVLVHAGTGGLGSTVIQLAKHLGAHVATTANGAKEQLVRDLGADVVIDYTKQDFAEILSGYDLVVDSLGGENLLKSLTVLKPGGLAIGVTGPPDAGFAKQLGAPKPFEFVLSFLSRKVRKAAKKLRRALRVLLHALQWCPAARARRALRRG